MVILIISKVWSLWSFYCGNFAHCDNIGFCYHFGNFGHCDNFGFCYSGHFTAGMALDAPLPDRWTDMKGEIDVVPLSPKNPDYRRVAEVFNKNPKQHQQKIKMVSQ